MKKYSAYINGEFVQSSNQMNVTYPGTGEVVAQVSSCSIEETEHAVYCAKQAFKEWKLRPSYDRAEQIKKFLTNMKTEEHIERIGTAITQESSLDIPV